jgi:ATP-dependent Lhr-like helicase
VDERLRAEREAKGERGALILASTDPASPWGMSLSWPAQEGARPMRAAGANVVIDRDGRVLAWIARKEHAVGTFFKNEEDAELVASALARAVTSGERKAWWGATRADQISAMAAQTASRELAAQDDEDED